MFLVTDTKNLDACLKQGGFRDLLRDSLMVQDVSTQAATSVCNDGLRHIHVWFVAAHVEFSTAPSRHTS